MFGPNKHCPHIPLEESMRNSLSFAAALCAVAVVSLAAPAAAQTPAPAQGAANIHAVGEGLRALGQWATSRLGAR